MSGLTVVNGSYAKNKQWRKLYFLGNGVAGRCHLAVDMTTNAQFCIKKVGMDNSQQYFALCLLFWHFCVLYTSCLFLV